MNLKKLLIGMTVLSMAAASFTGCKSNDGANGDIVKLHYVMTGPGIQEDSQIVWAEFNKRLAEKLPGVEVDFTIIPMSEYKQQFMLMQTTKEKIDIVNTYGLSFSDECRNGTFADVGDLLDTYGKDVKEALPEWLFDYMKVDGTLYGVPSYQQLANQYAIRVQKEYAKYLDVEALKAAVLSDDYTLKYDVIEDYLEKLKAENKIFKGFYIYTAIEDPAHNETIASNFVVDRDDPEKKVFYGFTTEEQRYHYQKMAEWYQKGYIRKDVLSATDNNNQIGRMDGFVMWSDFWDDSNAAEADKDKYGIETELIKLNDNIFIPKNNAAGGTSIMATSQHKEEAMQLINLLQTDKELYNLLVYGIEGTHYKKINENRIETLYSGSQGAANDKYGLYKWVVGNTEIAYLNQSNEDDRNDYVFNVINKSDYRSKLMGFIPDARELSDKIANIDAMKGEYNKSLATGADPHWEEKFEDWKEKLEIAGADEVIAELQRQVDEFLATKN